MTVNYKGNRYDYQVDIDFEYRTFEIYSKHLVSKRYSPITNINYIISELSDSLSEKDLIEGSIWEVETSEKLKKLKENTDIIFRSKKSIDFLEKQLDQDRLLGGWNSDMKF